METTPTTPGERTATQTSEPALHKGKNIVNTPFVIGILGLNIGIVVLLSILILLLGLFLLLWILNIYNVIGAKKSS